MATLKIQDCKICFIGGGNMGAAIIGGLLSQGSTTREKVIVSEPWDVNRKKLEENLGVGTSTSNIEAARDADVLVLAVKPQVAKGVCLELAASWSEASRASLPIVVSIVGGITLGTLTKWFTVSDGRSPKVVRVMPNTPALVGEGASASFASASVTEAEKELVTALLQGFSKTIAWVDKEELVDVATGLSGSGPAYFFLLVENMVASAVALGMPADQARQLAAQTCLGAGRMLVESTEAPAQLRINVTSPNGTTQAALETFNQAGFGDIVKRGVEAATRRGEELGKAAAAE